ncbi:MAG: substrate-binding domain-containing protein [Actinobacteria bacterium]|nr:substrate-binding domain-containing protein [Actinomycetota bacterium]
MTIARHPPGLAFRRSRALAVVALVVLVLLLPLLGGCGTSDAVKRDELIVATTTSLKDSGLIDDVVLPLFAKTAPDVTVKVLAVGSGEAMAMGARGEADVLLVHAPKDEVAFVAAGSGTLRLPVAYNFFVIVGPEGDPAGVKSGTSAADGFARIAAAQKTFFTRGDESGTNKKEAALWELAGVRPVGMWYQKTGQGMGETLRIASEKQGYTLTDLATYLSLRETLDLVPLSPKSQDLKNQYSVVLVDQGRFPTVNAAVAEQFAQVLVSAAGQTLIGDYGKAEYGEALFFPDAGALGSEGYATP